ncbi:HAMP domain-containing histidine kinase [Collinsella sp. AGMB00827]|uniref:Sensor-like histidine kinase SenX3 n=2 Tax=Collinsella ureilytica TaxID=2869515 RepID=A0ABS7MKM8_9ACTN|nr:HAMP domain-containing histidine kinase [Collinsella urealyticum]
MQVLDVDGTVLYDDTWPAAAVAAEIKREAESEAAARATAQGSQGTGEASSGAPSGSASSDAASSAAGSTTGAVARGGEVGQDSAHGTAPATPESDTHVGAAVGASSAATGVLPGDPSGMTGALPGDPSGATANTSSESASGRGMREERDEPAHALVSQAPTDQEGAISQVILTSDGTEIGTLRMWVLGSDALLTKADAAFRQKTFNAMGLAALVAVIISVFIGLLVSRMLTNPIRRITGTAKQIRDGDLTARTGMRGDDEIDRLGETFDEMAVSLEKDLRHERRLTSDVAHELRTPLMAMLATVEAMQDGVYPTDAEHLETVASETRRLARLVQKMLDISRMESAHEPMNIKSVDVVSLVRSIVANQEQLFIQRDLNLRFNDETQGKGATAEIDADMISQAVINIMSNAMRYTPEDGWVVVSVVAERKQVQISISDTGIGIAKEDLSRVFGRFWRADASRARVAGGLGVGLAVTKMIVERHQGFISVESELGHGTTFTINLPREHMAEAAE